MDAKQAKFIEENGWILKHTESQRLKPLIQASPLAIALHIWENIPQTGITLQDLAQKLNLNPNSVAIATRAMAKAGLIERCKNPANRRQTLIQKS